MRADGVLRIEIPVEVPFFDVDSMDVVWHGHYVKYLELARCTLLERIGHDYRQMKASGYLWPVVDLQLRYVRAARANASPSPAPCRWRWRHRRANCNWNHHRFSSRLWSAPWPRHAATKARRHEPLAHRRPRPAHRGHGAAG